MMAELLEFLRHRVLSAYGERPVEKVRAINAEIKRITYELKRGGLIP